MIVKNNIKFYLNTKKLKQNYENISKYGDIYYPLKTNSNSNLIKSLNNIINENDGFLISSMKHLDYLKKENVNLNKVCLINVFMEDENIKSLYNEGVRFFVFDNLNSLILFSKYADFSETKIAIRLSTNDIFKLCHTHIGANLNESLNMFDFLKKNNCNSCGIAFYIQKDLRKKTDILKNIFLYLKEFYSEQEFDFLSIGGIDLLKDAAEIENYKKEFPTRQLILETGRGLVENVVTMESKIIRKKELEKLSVVVLKNGIYSGFFDVLLYNKKFPMFLITSNNEKVEIKHEKDNESDYEFLLCGGSSDSADKIGMMYINSEYQNELVEGATLYIKNAGAYVEEFFMSYSNDLNIEYVEVDYEI